MRVSTSALAVLAAATLSVGVLALSVWPPQAQEAALGERKIAVNGVERSYLIHVPPNATRPAPVVFVFHGGGGRPDAIARRTGMDDVADHQGFVTVYPAGSGRASGRGGTWNVGGPASPSSQDDVAFVQAILRDLEQTLTVDRSRIYASGLSMGGVFSYRLACEMSGTFAAIAPVAATMVEPSCHPDSPVAVLHIHGTDDDRIPLKGGRGTMTAADRSWPAPEQGVSSWSRFDGCSAEQPARTNDGPATCTTYGQCRATVEFCMISGEGHRWPDGAAEHIWAFFAAHPKQAP